MRSQRNGMMAVAALAGCLAGIGATGLAQAASQVSFNMIRSLNLPANCARNAAASVTVQSQGFTERMTVAVRGLPANTALDLFVIQVPSAPFGVGWYVGDLQADASGKVTRSFVSRFNDETFAVAPGTAPAPTPHGSLDATGNPAFKPVHTFHVGIWFNSPADAQRAGCATTVTPFNGEHHAGIQVLSTRNFANAQGPLRQVN